MWAQTVNPGYIERKELDLCEDPDVDVLLWAEGLNLTDRHFLCCLAPDLYCGSCSADSNCPSDVSSVNPKPSVFLSLNFSVDLQIN